MALVLKCQGDPDFRKALNDDYHALARLLMSTLDSDSREAVLQLKGDDAERFLTLSCFVRNPDILCISHRLINNLQIFEKHVSVFDGDEMFRQKLHRLIVKLSESCGILPSLLNVTGVTDCSKEVVSGGGLADIFQATYIRKTKNLLNWYLAHLLLNKYK
jgi:hypothetical protein